MRKPLILFVVAMTMTSLFNACKKNENPPSHAVTASLSFTANGNKVSFNNCTATGQDDIPKTMLIKSIKNESDPATYQGIGIAINQDITTLKAGQVCPVETSANQPDKSIINFEPNSASDFTTMQANAQGLVTITNVTATAISGTFSAKLFAPSDIAGTTVIYTITDGTFTATR